MSRLTLKPGAKLTLHHSFGRTFPVLQITLALIFSAIAYLLVCHLRIRDIPGIRDLDLVTKINPGHRTELDGIRGIAALMVLMEHTWGIFAGVGATGVWLFFILSGYLLSQPFISNPGRIKDPAYVGAYLFRRLTRILPLYVFVLLIYFGFNGNVNVLIDHLLFLDAQGHFWTITQELTFYLALPVFMAIAYGFYRWMPIAGLGVLIAMCGAFLWSPELAVIQLYGNGAYKYPLVGWFLSGVCLAGIHHTLTTGSFILGEW